MSRCTNDFGRLPKPIPPKRFGGQSRCLAVECNLAEQDTNDRCDTEPMYLEAQKQLKKQKINAYLLTNLATLPVKGVCFHVRYVLLSVPADRRQQVRVSVGVCGKQPDTAALQDELVYELIRLAEAAAAAGQRTQIADRLLMDGLFITLTNVNFDNQAIAEFTERVRAEREKFGGKPCAVVELWKGDTDTDFAAFHAAVRHERHGGLRAPREESRLYG